MMSNGSKNKHATRQICPLFLWKADAAVIRQAG